MAQISRTNFPRPTLADTQTTDCGIVTRIVMHGRIKPSYPWAEGSWRAGWVWISLYLQDLWEELYI